MDAKSLEAVQERTRTISETGTSEILKYVGIVADYVSDHKPQHVFFPFDKADDMKLFAELIGLGSFQGADVLAVNYQNEMAYMNEMLEETFSGTWNVENY